MKNLQQLQKELLNIRESLEQMEETSYTKIAVNFTAFLGDFSELLKDLKVQVTFDGYKFNFYGFKHEREKLFSIDLHKVVEWYNLSNTSQIYDELQLSYYTSNSNTPFDLKRLQLLGKVAELIEKRGEEILSMLNTEYAQFMETRSNSELLLERERIKVQIEQLKELEFNERVDQVTNTLYQEGVEFNPPRQVTLKNSFSPRLSWLKVLEESASGKSCEVLYRLAHHDAVFTEDRVRLDRIRSLVGFIASETN